MNTFAMVLLASLSIFRSNVEVYKTSAVVTTVTSEHVVFEDSDDMVWVDYDSEGWTEGDIVSLTMSDNGTPEVIEDDVILNADKILHLEETEGEDWFLIDDGDVVI